MAVGINQVGGNGGNITFEDNANAAAGGDGSYNLVDFKGASDAGAWKAADGVTPAIEKLGNKYLIHCNIVNGDGALSNVTTWLETDTNFEFDSVKTYSVSATGRANRFTEWGVLVDGTKDSARQGVDAVFAASTTIQGNAKIYGSKLKVLTGGNLVLAPGQTGLVYQVINCILYAVTGAVAVGIASTGNVDVAYNIDVTGGSAIVGAINNWGATSSERITAALNPAGVYHVRTSSVFSMKDIVFVGTGAGSGAQLRLGSSGQVLVAPTWDQSLRIVDSTNGAGDEYWPYGVVVLDGNAAPIAGLPLTLASTAGGTVINTTTDANGMISYGSGITANCAKVVAFGASGSRVYQGPYTARINQGALSNPNYPTRTITFNWPSTAIWLTDNVQYQDMFDIIQLIPPAGLPTGWTERIVPTII